MTDDTKRDRISESFASFNTVLRASTRLIPQTTTATRDGDQCRVRTPMGRQQHRIPRGTDAELPLPEIDIRRQVRRSVRGVHEEQGKHPLGDRRGVIPRAEYRTVVVVNERDILREPTAGAWSNVPEDVGKVLGPNPVKIDGESADRFQVFAKRIRIGDSGDDLIRDSAEIGIEHGISVLRADGREDPLPNVLTDGRIDVPPRSENRSLVFLAGIHGGRRVLRLKKIMPWVPPRHVKNDFGIWISSKCRGHLLRDVQVCGVDWQRQRPSRGWQESSPGRRACRGRSP